MARNFIRVPIVLGISLFILIEMAMPLLAQSVPFIITGIVEVNGVPTDGVLATCNGSSYTTVTNQSGQAGWYALMPSGVINGERLTVNFGYNGYKTSVNLTVNTSTGMATAPIANIIYKIVTPTPTAKPSATPTITPTPTPSPVAANLLVNPSFETGLAPWQFYAAGSTGTLIQSSNWATNGTYSAKVSSGSNSNDVWEMLYQGGLSWSAGDKLTFTYDLNITQTCTIVTKIGDWNTNTLNLYTSNSTRLNPGVYRSNSITVTSPSTTNGNGMVYIILSSNPTNSTIYVDNATLSDN
jgi:hypothetical protein